jgi:hypothetical protein|tara:strand:+ start:1059 stop:1865 length:807 start_codon:yes stop_codon:yes gene_type:complete
LKIAFPFAILLLLSACSSYQSIDDDYKQLNEDGLIKRAYTVEKTKRGIFVNSLNNLGNSKKPIPFNLLDDEKDGLKIIFYNKDILVRTNYLDFKMANFLANGVGKKKLNNRFEIDLIVTKLNDNFESQVVYKDGFYHFSVYVDTDSLKSFELNKELFLLMVLIHETMHVSQALNGSFDGIFINKRIIESEAYAFSYCVLAESLRGISIDLVGNRERLQRDFNNVRNISIKSHIDYLDYLIDTTLIKKIPGNDLSRFKVDKHCSELFLQ